MPATVTNSHVTRDAGIATSKTNTLNFPKSAVVFRERHIQLEVREGNHPSFESVYTVRVMSWLSLIGEYFAEDHTAHAD